MKEKNVLKRRSAFVTGGSSGIGSAISHELSKRGITVYIGYNESYKSAMKLKNDIIYSGGNAEIIQVDVSDYNSVIKLRDSFHKEKEFIDILVNNAGKVLRPGGWLEQDYKQVEETVHTNLLSVIYTMKAFVPDMINNNYGRIINISSTFAKSGAAQVLSYTASKAGVDNITKSMARELGKFGITVNSVSPTVVDTKMARDAGNEFIKWAIDNSPLKVLAEPLDIAKAVVFMISQAKVTGQDLIVDAGLSLNVC